MLLQTNSYIVATDRRAEHARLMRRFQQSLARLGCDHFEVYEQVGANWASAKATGRFVQIMRFRDRRHYQEVQAAERSDAAAQDLIREFCELIDFAAQQEDGLFAIGFYNSALPTAATRAPNAPMRRGTMRSLVAPTGTEGFAGQTIAPMEPTSGSASTGAAEVMAGETIPADERPIEGHVIEEIATPRVEPARMEADRARPKAGAAQPRAVLRARQRTDAPKSLEGPKEDESPAAQMLADSGAVLAEEEIAGEEASAAPEVEIAPAGAMEGEVAERVEIGQADELGLEELLLSESPAGMEEAPAEAPAHGLATDLELPAEEEYAEAADQEAAAEGEMDAGASRAAASLDDDILDMLAMAPEPASPSAAAPTEASGAASHEVELPGEVEPAEAPAEEAWTADEDHFGDEGAGGSELETAATEAAPMHGEGAGSHAEEAGAASAFDELELSLLEQEVETPAAAGGEVAAAEPGEAAEGRHADEIEPVTNAPPEGAFDFDDLTLASAEEAAQPEAIEETAPGFGAADPMTPTTAAPIEADAAPDADAPVDAGAPGGPEMIQSHMPAAGEGAEAMADDEAALLDALNEAGPTGVGTDSALPVEAGERPADAVFGEALDDDLIELEPLDAEGAFAAGPADHSLDDVLAGPPPESDLLDALSDAAPTNGAIAGHGLDESGRGNAEPEARTAAKATKPGDGLEDHAFDDLLSAIDEESALRGAGDEGEKRNGAGNGSDAHGGTHAAAAEAAELTDLDISLDAFLDETAPVARHLDPDDTETDASIADISAADEPGASMPAPPSRQGISAEKAPRRGRKK